MALQAVHDDLLAVVAAFRTTPVRQTADRILVVKLDRIGDMVNTTPVFDVLRRMHPGVPIDVLGHPAVTSLLDGDDRIAERFTYVSSLYHGSVRLLPRKGAIAVVRQLLARRYSRVIYLRGTFLTLLLGLTSQVSAARFVESEPVLERYMKPLGWRGPHPQPRLHVQPSRRLRAALRFPPGRGPCVVVHPVSAAEGKQWPLERFAETADVLAREHAARVLFLASTSERAQLRALAAMCREPHQFETSLTLPDVVATIAAAHLFIGNDSGLSHIAAAVQTPLVVTWGGANLRMARPVAPPLRCEVLYRDVPCRAGCPETRCTGPVRLQCLTGISVRDVIAAAESMLPSETLPMAAASRRPR